MLHLFNQTFVSPLEFYEGHSQPRVSFIERENKFEDYERTSLEKYLLQGHSDNSKAIFWLDEADFLIFTRLWFNLIFRAKDDESFESFMRFYKMDIRLKANRFDYVDKAFYGMRSFSLQNLSSSSEKSVDFLVSARTLSFEILLYNALATGDEQFWAPLLERIEELSWKKLIYDWLVLKNQIINAFSNDLSKLCGDERNIPEEPKERLEYLRTNSTFRWMFDPKFRPTSWRHVKDHYDAEIYADLYSSWIRYRKSQPLDERNLKYIKLKEVITDMKNSNWKKLLMKDLEANWVSVYIESSEYKMFNLALVGRIYDLYNKGRLEDLSFLLASESVVA